MRAKPEKPFRPAPVADLSAFALGQTAELAERALTRPVPVVSPEPCLVWPLPGYVPPSQNDARNKLAVYRSREAKRLRQQLGWTLLAKKALSRPVEKGPRLVLVTSFMPHRRYDDANFRQSLKGLIDSLQPEHLPNDNPVWCVDHYRQFIAAQVGMPVGTVVMVYPIVGWEPQRLPIVFAGS